MTRRYVICDTETTSLVPDYTSGSGVIWELAVIDSDGPHFWRMRPNLAKANAGALAVGRFYERTYGMCEDCPPGRAHDLTVPPYKDGKPEWSGPAAVALTVARRLDDATLVGANPTFDAAFLTAFLNHHGQAATWHYRLRDIGSMAYGWLHGLENKPPPEALPLDASTDDFAFALGLNLTKYERHSALGDCQIVADMLKVIQGGTP